MKLQLACILTGSSLLLTHSSFAVPILYLQERAGQYIDWEWSDGSGSGTFTSTTPISSAWVALSFPFPSGVSDTFYGQWEEDSNINSTILHRNHVYITPGSTLNSGVFNANSDWPHGGGPLTPLGDPIDSYNNLYQVVFRDGPDHENVADSGSSSLLLAGGIGALICVRRRLR